MNYLSSASGVNPRFVNVVFKACWLSLAILGFVGSSPTSYGEQSMTDKSVKPLFFDDPEQAVELIDQLVRDSNWPTLTRYYALASTDPRYPTLLNGSFFIERGNPPSTFHPGGFWRFKEPFAPGFQFHYTDRPSENIVKVIVQIEIEQGEGMPAQIGLDEFYLQQSPEGYQLLATADVPPELPLGLAEIGAEVLIESPIDDSLIEKAADGSLIGKPVDDSLVEKRVDDSLVQRSANGALIEKTVDDFLVERPVDDSLIGKRVDDSLVKKTVDDSWYFSWISMHPVVRVIMLLGFGGILMVAIRWLFF